jgi:peroxiredoxin
MRRALFAVSCAVTLRAGHGIAVGDKVPDVGLDSGFPPEKVKMGDFCKGKKVVVVGLPGAFTPT